MKNIKYLIIIAILLIFNIILAYKFKLNNKAHVLVSSLINKKLDIKKNEILTFKQNFINEKTSENLKLQGDIELIDINGSVILAKDIFNKKSIALRYSEFNCHDCIEAEINALLKNKDKLKEDIIILVFYHEKRDLFVYFKELEKKGLDNIKMYLLPDKGLNIPIEELNTPYYFCIDSNLKMTSFFIPQKDNPELSTAFLNYTTKNYFNSN